MTVSWAFFPASDHTSPPLKSVMEMMRAIPQLSSRPVVRPLGNSVDSGLYGQGSRSAQRLCAIEGGNATGDGLRPGAAGAITGCGARSSHGRGIQGAHVEVLEINPEGTGENFAHRVGAEIFFVGHGDLGACSRSESDTGERGEHHAPAEIFVIFFM